ncbi:hypothetical protein B296_00000914, partial [Ensete ventricosum]
NPNASSAFYSAPSSLHPSSRHQRRRRLPLTMMKIKTPKTQRAKREVEKRAPKLVSKLFRLQVVENLNLAGIDHVFVCTALSSSTVFFTHCALRLKRSGTAIPRMELVEVGPSMDLVVRRHRLPNDSLKKEAMKTTSGQPKKKVCASHLSPKSKGWFFPLVLVGVQEVIIINNGSFVLLFKVGGIALSNDVKGLKRERREARKTKVVGENEAKKRKKASE